MADATPLMEYPPTSPEDLPQYVGPTVAISGGRVAVEQAVAEPVAVLPAPLVLVSGKRNLPQYGGRGMETQNVL